MSTVDSAKLCLKFRTEYNFDAGRRFRMKKRSVLIAIAPYKGHKRIKCRNYYFWRGSIEPNRRE
ncbi:hypothetical protein B2G47_05370 [Leptospira interrogans serovar Canicola]|nr:hypothetical protein B2G47_05370 [Leptospira interrogans serovar Canicola]